MLENLSLVDFVELLEVAGGTQDPTAWLHFPSAWLDLLMESRFRFLVEHLRSDENARRGDNQDPDDPMVKLTESFQPELAKRAKAKFLNVLSIAGGMFSHALHLKRRERRVGRTNVPMLEPGQVLYPFLYTAFSPMNQFVPDARELLPIWFVNEHGRLQRKPEDDPSELLMERLFKLFENTDPARIRRCAYPKCNRVFFAKRPDSLCCSRRCNNNRLQREWYEKEIERIRQVSSLYQNGVTDLDGISKKLGITKGKTRGYLSRAKKELRK
ncbi:MAG TPA: hypothetical protein VKB84_08565 [Candidatus Binataceae bacterium]|jgi:hypothetical protein|nr:hypothetical protein [Candidatus Binataceae bacterium]